MTVTASSAADLQTKVFGELFNFAIVHVLQKMNINPQRLYYMSICRQCPPAVPTVEGSCVSHEKTSTELSAKRHNRRIRFVERAYRYSKWLHGTLQVTVSWNPHRRANMPLVLHGTGTDGYDMDYTDSKSIRPRSWVCNGLVNCLWKPFYDSASWLSAAQLQPLYVLLQGGDNKQKLIKRK